MPESQEIPKTIGKELHIKELSPQRPEIPWNKWLNQTFERFKYWTQKDPSDTEWHWPPRYPNLPEEHQQISPEIPNYDTGPIRRVNGIFRKLRGEGSKDIFYRPGIGYGGLLNEIIEKVGTFGTMVVTDPVYEKSEMSGWSEGLLPVDYYVETLKLLNPKNLKVSIAEDYTKEGRELPAEEYSSAQIPKGGMAKISVTLNGVQMDILLLAEDMTKLNLSKYDSLGLGRPTPYNPEKAVDPRGDLSFNKKIIKGLSTGGLIDYFEDNFTFLPKDLPPQVLGFKLVYDQKGNKIVQKVEDLAERLDPALQINSTIHEALGALAGILPGTLWLGYYKHLEGLDGYEKVTLADVVSAYGKHLEEIRAFIETLPQDQAITMRERMEFLFMNPIATSGKIDIEKIKKINKSPANPYKPKERGAGSDHPYFGSPLGLIRDHNNGEIDIFLYYQQLIDRFYATFPGSKSKPDQH